jgi:hypothetical protein
VKEQIPLLLGVLPVRLISSPVPDGFKILRTIDFAKGGKITAGENLPGASRPGRICRARQELPGVPGK